MQQLIFFAPIPYIVATTFRKTPWIAVMAAQAAGSGRSLAPAANAKQIE